MHVAQPLGDYLPYDLIVDSGQELLRIQVKSTTAPEAGKPGKYGFTLKSGSNGSAYSADSVDFFALVILPLYAIYIVPQSAVSGKVKAYAYPENSNSAGTLERYRENWELL